MSEDTAQTQAGNFFNEQQKIAKSNIMANLANSINDDITKYLVLFPDKQSFSDLIVSILVMFNREVLVNWFKVIGHDSDEDHKGIIKYLFKTVDKEVKRKLKESK